MKEKISQIALSLIVAFSAFQANAEDGWNLVFEDNFDGISLDRTKWAPCKRYSSTWNHYLVDSEENIFVSDGCLNLRATVNTDSSDDVPYHTGGVETQGIKGITYGKVEVRAKIQKGQGNFPAIWMMPTNGTGGWPACGEIDIMEQISNESIIYMTVHSKYHNTLGYSSPSKGGTTYLNPEEYHVYSLQKYKDRLEWYIDGTLQFVYSDAEKDADLGQWPFDKEFYLILDQACGGGWAGTPDPAVFPLTMNIDYVKMYELVPSAVDDTEADETPLAAIVRNNGYLNITPAENAVTMRVLSVDGSTLYDGKADDVTLPVPSALVIVEVVDQAGDVQQYKK